MPKIIVSYRRSDSQAMAGRIYDRLSAQYGDESVFMDIDKIPVGTDFRQYIRGELQQADLLLAIIGPRWLGPREGGRNRINDRADPVRVEIETALEGQIPVVPVLVDGAQMPDEEQLPDSLKDFVFINAALVDIGRDFRQHMDRLIRAIEAILAARATALKSEPKPDTAGGNDRPMSPPASPLPIHETVDARPAEEARPVRQEPVHPRPASQRVPERVESPSVRAVVEATENAMRRPSHPALAIMGVFLGVGLTVGMVYWTTNIQAVAPNGATSAPTGVAAQGQETASLNPVSPPLDVARVRPPDQPAAPMNAAAPQTRINAANVSAITWKLQNTLPTNTATTLPLFAKRTGDLSAGRMRVETLPTGAVVPAFQIIDAVHSGILDLGYGSGFLGYSKHKALALMSAVPFGFAPRDHIAFRRRPEVKAAFNDLIAGVLKLSVVTMPCGTFGRSGEFWLKRVLRQKSDLVGQKLRFVGPAAEIYKVIGSAVTVLPGGELVPAIDRGIVDGGQYLNPKNDLDLGFADVLKHYYYPSSVTPAYTLDLYVNKNKWNALSPDGRQIIEAACREAADEMIVEQERLDQEALTELKRRGVIVSPVPAAVVRDLYAASEKVLTEQRRDAHVDKVMRIVDQLLPNRIPVTQR